MRVQGDIAAGKMIHGVEGVDPARRAALVELLEIDPEWRLNKVSDGQRRRVQICMGLLKPYQARELSSSFPPARGSWQHAWPLSDREGDDGALHGSCCTRYCERSVCSAVQALLHGPQRTKKRALRRCCCWMRSRWIWTW